MGALVVMSPASLPWSQGLVQWLQGDVGSRLWPLSSRWAQSPEPQGAGPMLARGFLVGFLAVRGFKVRSVRLLCGEPTPAFATPSRPSDGRTSP